MSMNLFRLSVVFAVAVGPACAAEEAPGWAWEKSDTSLALQNRGKTVWRLVADPKQPKSYFHPLATVEGEVLTAFEPSDHRWHRGLWWSWKFINGVNYWEENPKTGASEGVTELTRAELVPGNAFRARAELHFRYHPTGKPVVMTEVRHFAISAPDEDGRYTIDATISFTAGTEEVVLDRTPPPTSGGPAYGGYGGLSLRFPRDLKGWTFRSSGGITKAAEGHGQAARWVDLSGPTAGIAIFDHPGNLRHPQAWYLSDNPSLMFFNPALLFHEPLKLAANSTTTLRYRVLVHSKPLTAEKLDAAWQSFSSSSKP